MSKTDQVYKAEIESFLRVKGIESWIQSLVKVQETNPTNEYDAIRMMDPETGALFAVTRIKEPG